MRAVVALLFGAILVQFIAHTFAALDGVCVLQMTEAGKKLGFDVKGTVRFNFDPIKGKFRVLATIEGNQKFKENDKYAMHVHTYGDLTEGVDGNSTGLHWVPPNGYTSHGCPDSDKRHGGDMGNWTQSEGRIAEVKELDLLEMTATSSILGRAVVLHERRDDCETAENGNSGARIAFCVIGLTNEDFNYAVATDHLDGDIGVCVMQPTSHCKDCSGTVFLRAVHLTSLEIVGKFKGLKVDSVHGFHLKSYGDLRLADGSGLGDDYNPFGRDHGLPPLTPRHLGDFGNIQNYDKKTGEAWYFYNDSYVPHLSAVVGRALAVYSGADRGKGSGCSDTGSAGDVLMQCVVGAYNPATRVLEPPTDFKFNNKWESLGCHSKELDNAEDAEAGLLAGLVFGWVLVGLLMLLILGIFGYMLWVKKHGGNFQIINASDNRGYGSEL